jgi:hypothetical protein
VEQRRCASISRFTESLLKPVADTIKSAV